MLSQIVVAQQKQMTLEDAILGRYNGLNTETLNGLSWKNDNIFTWLKNDTLWAESAKKGEVSTLTNLDEINALMQTSSETNFRHFPQYSWLNDAEILVRNRNKFLIININEDKIAWKVAVS